MSITESELKRRLRPWVKELIMAGGGSGGPFLSGSGTTGQVAEWGASTVLQAASLAKTGAGLLTLASAGAYTLTVPLTGTAVVGSGVTGRLMAWADAHTAGTTDALSVLGDLAYYGTDGGVETALTELLEATLDNFGFGSVERVVRTISLSGVTAGDTCKVVVDLWASGNNTYGASQYKFAIRRGSLVGPLMMDSGWFDHTGDVGGHLAHWVETHTDTGATDGTYVLTLTSTKYENFVYSDYRYVKVAETTGTEGPKRLAIGSEDQFLRVSAGLPVWETVSVVTGVSDTASVDLTVTGSTLSAAVLPAGVDHNGLANLTVGNVHTQYLLNSLLTTRGDLIRRGASAPERYGLVVPAAGVLNYLGVANGETDPAWNSASSNPGAAAAVLASNTSGYLRLVRIGLGMAPSFPLDVTGQGRLVATSTADANTVGWVANLTKTAGVDDTRTNSAFQTTLNLAGTFAYSGVNSGMTATLNHSGSGLASDLSGIYFIGGVASTGNVTTFDIIRARPFGAGAGVISTLSAFHIYDIAATGTPVTAFGVRIDASTGAVGTSKYGISIGNISGASTNNVAINTAAGLINFGDQVKIDGSADRIQEIVQAHSTQTANLTEWQASNAAVQAYVTGTGGAVFNEAGTATGDVRIETDTEPDMVFTDASADTIYLGGQTNGITIGKGGELTLIGTATVFKDQFVDGLSTKGGATDPPVFAAFSGGVWANRFDDAAVQSVHASIELQHDYKDGSNMEFHIHWAPSTTNTGNCRWGLEYTVANMLAAFPATTTVYAVQAGSGTVNQHQYLTVTTITGTGLTKGAVIMFRVFRDGTNAADTFTGNSFLIRCAVHYEADRLGSAT